jgi:hypothetical protein
VKIIGGGFEADTLVAASCQRFILNSGEQTTIIGPHLTRNGASVQYEDTSIARATIMQDVHFRGTVNSTTGVLLGGVGGSIDAVFTDGKTGYSLVCTTPGYDLRITGRSMGAIDLGEGNSLWLNLVTATTNNAYALEIKSGSTAFVKMAGTGSGAGAVKLTGTNPTLVAGSTIKDFTGIGVRIETENAVVQGVSAYQTTAAAFSVSGGVNPPTRVFGNWCDDGSDNAFLTGTLVYDPASMAPGAVVGPVSVTVTGARVGDLALVSFSAYNTANVEVSGFVNAVDTAVVFFRNVSTTVTEDLGSGTITVRAVKV